MAFLPIWPSLAQPPPQGAKLSIFAFVEIVAKLLQLSYAKVSSFVHLPCRHNWRDWLSRASSVMAQRDGWYGNFGIFVPNSIPTGSPNDFRKVRRSFLENCEPIIFGGTNLIRSSKPLAARRQVPWLLAEAYRSESIASEHRIYTIYVKCSQLA